MRQPPLRLNPLRLIAPLRPLQSRLLHPQLLYLHLQHLQLRHCHLISSQPSRQRPQLLRSSHQLQVPLVLSITPMQRKSVFAKSCFRKLRRAERSQKDKSRIPALVSDSEAVNMGCCNLLRPCIKFRHCSMIGNVPYEQAIHGIEDRNRQLPHFHNLCSC
jgi:hypothetical protein